jgi:hypothetical protein
MHISPKLFPHERFQDLFISILPIRTRSQHIKECPAELIKQAQGAQRGLQRSTA